MNDFMKIAIEEASMGIKEHDGGPFGSVVVKDGCIIGRGHNEVIKNNDPTSHGEIMAIKDACKRINSYDLTGCVLYTTSKPCLMCLGAILWANISKVYYGCTYEDAERIGFRDKVFSSSFEIEKVGIEMICIDREECVKQFDIYSTLPNKRY